MRHLPPIGTRCPYDPDPKLWEVIGRAAAEREPHFLGQWDRPKRDLVLGKIQTGYRDRVLDPVCRLGSVDDQTLKILRAVVPNAVDDEIVWSWHWCGKQDRELGCAGSAVGRLRGLRGAFSGFSRTFGRDPSYSCEDEGDHRNSKRSNSEEGRHGDSVQPTGCLPRLAPPCPLNRLPGAGVTWMKDRRRPPTPRVRRKSATHPEIWRASEGRREKTLCLQSFRLPPSSLYVTRTARRLLPR